MSVNEFPEFLEDLAALLDYMNGRMEGLSNSEKGDFFAHFSTRLVCISPLGEHHKELKLNPKRTHDKGVDFSGESHGDMGRRILLGQAKYTLNSVKDLESVISYFEQQQTDISSSHSGKQGTLPLFPNQASNDPVFVIVTLSDLTRLSRKYEAMNLAAAEFYREIKREERIHIIDGPKVLEILRSSYRQSLELPATVNLELQSPPLREGDVYIGILSSKEIKKQYRELGDSIFLENIRVFLGPKSGRKDDRRPGRESVNEAISDTVSKNPEKMLARNNGITFRAGSITVDPENSKILHLERASIVNGCQTTMTLVNGDADHALILVKIVQTDDSWDIAKAANFQNEVKQVELDLAQFIRPQIIQKSSAESGFAYETETFTDSRHVMGILNTIYQYKIEYDQAYHLFVGFFSRTPNNAISPNYADLRYELLNAIKSDEFTAKKTYTNILSIVRMADESRMKLQKLRDSSQNEDNLFATFQRFFNRDNEGYHAFLTILTCCVLANKNIYSTESGRERSMTDLIEVFDAINKSSVERPSRFFEIYKKCFEVIMTGITGSNKELSEIKKSMNTIARQLNFNNYFSLVVTARRMEDLA